MTSRPDVQAGEPQPAAAGSPAPARPKRSGARGVVQWIVVIVVALVIASLLKSYVLEAFTIPSGSMEPTIDINDRVLVDKLSYDFGARPHTGDIVVFTKPADFSEPGVHDLIKRVIGTPGESLRSGPGGVIYVDGRLLAEPWLPAAARANPGPPICSIDRTDCVRSTLHLPPDMFLVMGDNRDNSDDGRYFGPIPGQLVVGRAFVRIWPLARIHWF